ncbi:MAG TPA: CpcT/CpeT family chromophore lyase [Steroidobacteraceae bacterium]|nr:CpcT/CpeT family chromophore lyase [Steroidobacteraceae bacterium]
MLRTASPRATEAADERDVLAELWAGMYDVSEEMIAGEVPDSPLASLTGQERVQINVRRVVLPWLGTHVLYVEEFPYDEPFERRRRVLLSLEPAAPDGTLRVRQFTRKAEARGTGMLSADDVESVPGCDLFLKRDGGQFRGGTVGRACLEPGAPGPRWLDYRVVIGDGLFWYRKRTLTLAKDELVEEIAGFPHVEPEEARLFSCGISWAKDKAPRRPLDSVDLHDRGGRARFRTPDGRELQLELHGRDWPLSDGRESLVLILTEGRAQGEPIASSWTSLDAARVGIDIGWLAIDCAPVVSETGEARS